MVIKTQHNIFNRDLSSDGNTEDYFENKINTQKNADDLQSEINSEKGNQEQVPLDP